MSEVSDFEDAFIKGQESKLIEKEINGVLHLLIPSNTNLQSMEKLMPAPIRIRAHPVFNDIAGFADYAEEFKVDGSRIFVDENDYSFETVFDHHAKDKPAWGDHSANLSLSLSDEWKRFRDLNDEKMSPIDFAEFIEDNLEYISAKNMTSGDLLAMAQTFKIKVKGDVAVTETLQQGSKLLHIEDDSKLTGTTKGKEVKFPEVFNIKMRIFKNCDRYSINVFLRYRARQDSLVFFIKIPDPAGTVELAFEDVIKEVAKQTKLKTLKGSFK